LVQQLLEQVAVAKSFQAAQIEADGVGVEAY